MLAELPPVLVDVGALAGIIAAVVTALALLAKTPPMRWLARRLIKEPFGDMLDVHLEPVTAAIAEGKAAAEQLRVDLTAHMQREERDIEEERQKREHRQELLDERLDDLAADVAEVKAGLGTVHGRIDLYLGGGNVEIRRQT